MKIIRFHRWDSMRPPYRKAITVCFLGWCGTIYYGRGVYAEYIGDGYCRSMSLEELKRRAEKPGIQGSFKHWQKEEGRK